MKIGILETGAPPAPLVQPFGAYPDMIRRLIGPGFTWRSYDVAAGNFPERPEDCDAWILTGSPAGAYEPIDWIVRLKQFLIAARGKAKLVGICFGHQAMVEGFGGKVAKSDRGWGVGLHRYDILARARWMDDASMIAVPASHQDQAVVQPPETDLIAASAFTPLAALAWRDQPAISFQFHPEFSPAFAKALIEQRRGRLPDPDAALESLDAPNDGERVGNWIRSFLERG